MANTIEQMGLDLYNALRGPMSRMETIEEMDNFKIELKFNKDIIVECMKCAEINIESGESMKRAGVEMNWERINHYNNLIIEACKNAIKEDKKMTMANEFTVDGKTYEVNEKGNRFFVSYGTIYRKRISQSAYEDALEQYAQEAAEQADIDAWQAEADAEIKARKEAEDRKDRETEDNFNKHSHKEVEKAVEKTKEQVLDASMEQLGYHRIDSEWDDIRYSTGDGQSKVMAWNTVEEGLEWVKGQTKEPKAKKVSKPRRSKDVAFEMNTIDGHITLTAKQVDFIKHIPDTCFYENGLESTPWCDVLADEIGGQFAGKPMTVGAMISTLREKHLIYVGMDRINGKKTKFFGFTDTGKVIAQKLGLE